MKGFLVKSVIFFFCVCLGFPGSLTSDNSRCFQLTWLGPGANNQSGIPDASTICQPGTDFCMTPTIYTPDGSYPDFGALWMNFPDNITCRPAVGDVCVKWTRYFDGQVVYTTHTCTRVTVVDEGTLTSGCVTGTANNSRWDEVCACSPNPTVIPCNSGQHPYTSLTVTGLLMVFFLALKCVT